MQTPESYNKVFAAVQRAVVWFRLPNYISSAVFSTPCATTVRGLQKFTRAHMLTELHYVATRVHSDVYVIYGRKCSKDNNIEVPGKFKLKGAVLKLFNLELQAYEDGWICKTASPSTSPIGWGLATVAAQFKIDNPHAQKVTEILFRNHDICPVQNKDNFSLVL